MPNSTPADLWLRLTEVERCCEVHLSSSAAAAGWRWHLEIRCPKRPDQPPIVVDHETPHGAMSRGLVEAERRGWYAVKG